MLDKWPDPRAAKDITGFVAALREVRDRSGLSYRALARRAEQAGDLLPVSTINAALSRNRLPRADLIAAFVRACGGDEPTVDAWLAARSDLAAGAESTTPDAEERPSRRRGRTAIAVTGVLTLVAVAVTVLVLTGDRQEPAAQQQPDPAQHTESDPKTVEITLAHTGLCVGEGQEKSPGSDRIVLGQYDCASASPPISVEPVADGRYQLILHNPKMGPGCATVDFGGKDAELLIAGADCRPGSADQEFTFEPVTSPEPGFRLRSVAGAKWCIGVYEGSTDPGRQLIQTECDNGPHQVFVLPAGQP